MPVFTKCPARGSIRVRTSPRGRQDRRSAGRQVLTHAHSRPVVLVIYSEVVSITEGYKSGF